MSFEEAAASSGFLRATSMPLSRLDVDEDAGDLPRAGQFEGT